MMAHRTCPCFLRGLVVVLLCGGLVPLLAGQAQAADADSEQLNHDPAAELASFRVADGYEVRLFASEKNGIANPVQMRWDPQGRLFVACSPMYPQIKPEETPNDKIVLLEDTNRDGVADRSSVFADGLIMPEGLAWGDHGVYVGQQTDLLHLSDTDGDGRADRRRVVLTGFGTGDTHQMINNFVWSPGGELFFGQGLHIFSHVETPWGIERLDAAGVWRLRPRRLKLDPFLGNDMPPHNPWGLVFDDWGQPILCSGNGHGNYWLTAAMIRHSDRRPLPTPWQRKKTTGAELLGGSHFGPDTANILVAGDFLSNGVLRFRIGFGADGCDFTTQELPPLIVSSHRAFRPSDIQMGPDGALYVADWYNPIIGHYQASFRHPDRDKTHGRIWRVTARGRPLVQPPQLLGLNPSQLLDQLRSPERWNRQQAKRRLADLETHTLVPELDRWAATLDPGDPQYEHLLFEVIGVYEAHEVVRPELLRKLMAAKDPRARAYAARVIGNWQDRLEQPLDLLRSLVSDPHPQVRLEAVVACSYVPQAQAMEVATLALDRPLNPYLDYALLHAVHALKPYWRPALAQGQIDFGKSAQRLAYVGRADGGQDLLAQLRAIETFDRLSPDRQRELLETLARIGGAADLRFVLLRPDINAALLDELADTWRVRRLRPTGEVEPRLQQLLAHQDVGIQAAAVRLVGAWQQKAWADRIEALAQQADAPLAVRISALGALPALRGATARPLLEKVAQGEQRALWPAAVAALAEIDLPTAAQRSASLILRAEDDQEVGRLLAPIVGRKRGAEVMATALAQFKLPVAAAQRCRQFLAGAGIGDPALMLVINRAAGLETHPQQYDPVWIAKLAAETRATGSAERGRTVFASKLLNCAACHKLDGVGGSVGPDLSSIGRALPVDRLIEEVVWPQRQVKEGYLAVSVSTGDGRIFEGMKVSESAAELVLRDAVQQRDVRIAKSDIEERRDVGSQMPVGLTDGLPRRDLLDLIRFLAERNGLGSPGSPQPSVRAPSPVP